MTLGASKPEPEPFGANCLIASLDKQHMGAAAVAADPVVACQHPTDSLSCQVVT